MPGAHLDVLPPGRRFERFVRSASAPPTAIRATTVRIGLVDRAIRSLPWRSEVASSSRSCRSSSSVRAVPTSTWRSRCRRGSGREAGGRPAPGKDGATSSRPRASSGLRCGRRPLIEEGDVSLLLARVSHARSIAPDLPHIPSSCGRKHRGRSVRRMSDRSAVGACPHRRPTGQARRPAAPAPRQDGQVSTAGMPTSTGKYCRGQRGSDRCSSSGAL